MFPWYHGYRGDGDLPEDDRLAIQSLYGVRDGARQWGPNPSRRHHYTQPTTKTTTTTTRRPPTRYYHHHTNARDEVTRRTQNTRNPLRPRYYPQETTTLRTPYSTYRPYHRHPKPDTCNTAYDAITIIRGEVFIFKNRYLWRISNNGLMPGYPHEITKMWRDLPQDLTHVDTVYENKKRQIVFFIGEMN